MGVVRGRMVFFFWHFRVGGGKGCSMPGLQGYFCHLHVVCRVGGFTTNSKPIVKIYSYLNSS
jgi:hypothetical protein